MAEFRNQFFGTEFRAPRMQMTVGNGSDGTEVGVRRRASGSVHIVKSCAPPERAPHRVAPFGVKPRGRWVALNPVKS